MGEKNIKLKGFRQDYEGDRPEATFDISDRFEFKKSFTLNEENFEGLEEVFFWGTSFIRDIKLHSNINYFKISPVESSAFCNCIDLSNVSRYAILDPTKARNCCRGIHIEGTRVKKVILPKHLEYLSKKFFDYCKELIDVVIPATLKEIEPCAFNDCYSLKQITYLGTMEQGGQVKLSHVGRASSGIESVKCSDGIIELKKRR